MAVVEVKVFPIGTDEASMSSFVRDCFEVAESAPDVEVTLTPTATVMEGDLEDIFPVIEAMHKSPFNDGVRRVISAITIDDRVDKPLTMDHMVLSVLEDDVPVGV